MSEHELPAIKLKFLKKKSLLTILQNSTEGGENRLFRNVYARDEKGNEIDILENGKNSCAAFVSWVLLTVELIKRPHATVESTEKDLLASDWVEINEPRPGAVLIWDKIEGEMLGIDNVQHRHIGFYVGNEEAISNSQETGSPVKHHFTYNGKRKIQKILWHPLLED
jgi:hypothetical protein